MKTWRTLLLPPLAALLLCGTGGALAQRPQTALDAAWRFQRTEAPEAARPDFDAGAWTDVALPHTWNGVDGEAGGPYYRGAGWYRRVIERPAPAPGRRQFLEFDGATMAAQVETRPL